MRPPIHLSRRNALAAMGLCSATAMIPEARAAAKDPEIKYTLKVGMVRLPNKPTLEERFAMVKAVGYDAIEMNSPGMNVEETKAAINATGLRVDGTVCSSHWQVRHTSPDAEVRAKALSHLKQALKDTKAVGGDTVLLVVGRGEDGEEGEIWDRSIANIRQAVPLAEDLGMTIAIENVWNQFLYDHNGGSDQTAEKFVQYVDEFESPHVAMQFDIGNHWKYGNTGDWIRALGRRVVKLDSKGFSRKQNKFTKIGEGDVDWKDVKAALGEIGFKGYCAAEVGGGGKDRLKEVLANMRRTLG